LKGKVLSWKRASRKKRRRNNPSASWLSRMGPSPSCRSLSPPSKLKQASWKASSGLQLNSLSHHASTKPSFNSHS